MKFICDLCGWSIDDEDELELITNHYTNGHQSYADPTLMPVKNVDKFEFDLEVLADRAHMLLEDIKTSQPKPEIKLLFVPPNEAYLKAVANVAPEYYNQVLDHVKPANYKD